jgi:ABC-type transporter Mla MlaB component
MSRSRKAGLELQALQLAATKSTPRVSLDPANQTLSLEGQSYPENAYKFYEPIFSWLDQYLQEQQRVKVEIRLSYLNTSSSKCLMMFLDKLEGAHNQGKRVELNWFYDPDNESELESAEEFQEDISFPFYVIPAAEA